MNTTFGKAENVASLADSLRLELERSQRELVVCRERMEQMEGLFAHVVDAIFVAETDGRIVDANPAACALLGYAKAELLALYPWDFVMSASREEILGVMQTMRLGAPITLQRTYRCQTGEQKLIDLRLTRCMLGGRDLIIVSCRDITRQITHLAAVAIEQKKSEEALRASELLARGQVNALTRTLDALAMESAPDRLVEHVLRTITEQLFAHSSSVWKWHEASGLVAFEFALEGGKLVTKSDSQMALISPSLPVQNVWPWPEVFRTGKPSLLEDIRQGPVFPWRDHLLAQGIISILIVPMLMAGRVDGVIGIRFTQKRTFRAEEMELAQALANQAMLAMQLTRLSIQSRQSAVMAERNRMARDVHDTLAQGFTGVIIQLEAAADATSKGFAVEAGGHLSRAGELARESLREARRSVRALRPQALEESDLCDALESLFKKMTAGTSLRAEFVLHGQSRPRPLEWDENLLRIGQEVLTNTLRHARASYFKAELAFTTDEVRLDLRDDGLGFDPEIQHDGFGLLGIKERVEGMGGCLTIQSAKGSGTVILIVLPLKNNTEAQAP